MLNNNFSKKRIWKGVIMLIIFLLGFILGTSVSYYFYLKLKQEIISAGVPIIYSEKVTEKEYIPQTTQEEKIINIVKENSSSVVSILSYKDVSIYSGDLFLLVPGVVEEEELERQQVGAGTGFIISEDGLVVTNKHVVSDNEAEYVVKMTDGKEYNAKVLAKDPVQDLAILKIEAEEPFIPLKLGSTDDIQIGQTVIAIGNALGQFQNTVSVGVISGLGRTVVATDSNLSTEKLEDIIQTDAAINKGNSGGPLINLKGEVIGINTAVYISGQSIGFAILMDNALRSINQVKETGKISYPYMGVRYIVLNKEISKSKELSVDYGALLIKGEGETNPAVITDSPAEKSGLKEGDIILEAGGEVINENKSLAKIISKYDPFETVNLKVLRGEEEIYLNIILGEWE